MSTATKLSSADISRLIIPSPCQVGWDNMTGDERSRMCGQCDRRVYNLAAMTTNEVIEMVSGNERVCGRLHRRADGTVVTGECPVPAASPKKLQFSIATLLILITSCAALCASVPWLGRRIEPIVQRWLKPTVDVSAPVIETWEGEIMISEDWDPEAVPSSSNEP